MRPASPANPTARYLTDKFLKVRDFIVSKNLSEGKLLPSALLITLALAVSYHLGRYGLFDWDEAIYADVSRNVLRGNFSVLKWGSQLWFEKPPLYFWLTGSLFKLFGVNDFSARLLSAISGVGLGWLMFRLSAKLFGRKVANLVLVTVLLNSFLLFHFRFGTTDIFALLLNTAAVYFFWQAQQNKRYLMHSAACLGLAAMTKGPVVLSAILFFAAYAFLTGQTASFIRSKFFWLGSALFLAVALPWHIYMLEKFGRSFYDIYIDYHILKRAREPIEGHTGDHLYYPRLIFENFPLAWSLLLLPLVRTGSDYLKRKKNIIFVLLWLAVQYVSIISVATKLPWYVLPVFVPLQILVSFLLISLSRNWRLLGPLIVVLAIAASAYVEFRQPYFRWAELPRFSENRDCILAYKEMGQAEEIALGYNRNGWPTLFYYLDSDSVLRLEHLADVPPSSIILVNTGQPPPSRAYRMLYGNSVCSIIRTPDQPRR